MQLGYNCTSNSTGCRGLWLTGGAIACYHRLVIGTYLVATVTHTDSLCAGYIGTDLNSFFLLSYAVICDLICKDPKSWCMLKSLIIKL